MKLIINASLAYGGGGLQVALSFINECLYIRGNQYYVFASRNVVSQLDKSIFPDNFIFYDIPPLKFYQYNFYLSQLEKKILPDVVFSIFGPVYWKPSVPHIMGYAIPHYIYKDSPYWDIISIKERLKMKIKEFFHMYFLKRDASAFICETDDVQTRLALLFPEKKCYKVSNTYSSFFEKKVLCRDFIELKDTSKFRFLTVSRYYPHKNLEIIRLIVDKLRENDIKDIQFVLTISPSDYEKIFGIDYVEEVKNVGPVIASECPSLYNDCDAVFLPSLLECFSANYPEAMIMKKPILTSDLPFARTVCGNAALYFTPLNVMDAVDKILLIYHDDDCVRNLLLFSELKLREFPLPCERAHLYLEICEKERKGE
ncbi:MULTISPECIES: glycosyltransferase [Bacteroides]|uniref:glycosyltransferase n=1 Tax=Bacteroides TaxID=816 RepID=UPI0013EBCDCC|nr:MULTISPECIES: glycosyltransferase [Bacteroides]MBW9276331.1 glycosyltransferase [Bacteroides fragilis]QTO24478.1 glycosyltransferase [Bacteroides sp. ZJ-18]